MVSYAPGRLHRVDLDALSASTIGSLNFGSAAEWAPTGLASHGGKLYMIGSAKDRLYELDPATGAATTVGSETSFGTVNETDPQGLASHGSSLYMTGGANDWLYTLNTSTGAATRVGAVTGFGVSETAPAGIASGYVKPRRLLDRRRRRRQILGYRRDCRLSFRTVRPGQRRPRLPRQCEQRRRRLRAGDGDRCEQPGLIRERTPMSSLSFPAPTAAPQRRRWGRSPLTTPTQPTL